MTREEAIKILDTIPTIGEQVDALEMAIRSLEAWDNFYEWLKALQEQQEEIGGGVSVLTSIHLQPLIEAVEKIFGGTV